MENGKVKEKYNFLVQYSVPDVQYSSNQVNVKKTSETGKSFLTQEKFIAETSKIDYLW